MKAAGCILLFLAFALAGLTGKQYYESSIREWENWEFFLMHLRQEIECCSRPVEEAVLLAGQASGSSQKSFSRNLQASLKTKDNFAIVWKEEIARQCSGSAFDPAQKNLLKQAGGMLEQPWQTMEAEHIRLLEAQMKELGLRMKKELREKEKLCTGLSVALGLFCILLIL